MFLVTVFAGIEVRTWQKGCAVSALLPYDCRGAIAAPRCTYSAWYGGSCLQCCVGDQCNTGAPPRPSLPPTTTSPPTTATSITTATRLTICTSSASTSARPTDGASTSSNSPFPWYYGSSSDSAALTALSSNVLSLLSAFLVFLLK